MTSWILPVLFAVFLWWSSTVLVLYLNGLSRQAARRSFWVASAIGVLSAAAVALTLDDASVSGAYVAFTAGVLIWGWHEVSYYAGMITGPSSAPCPPDTTNWERFRRGVSTCLHHELAIIAMAAVLGVLCWNAANPVAFWTFSVLWIMRWSAKLNIFFGVRNLHAEFWPEHLKFLTTYARRRSMNPLYPLSIVGGGVALAVMISTALQAPDGSGIATGLVLCASMLALAIVEHGFLMVPISDDALWQWGMRSHEQRRTVPAPADRF